MSMTNGINLSIHEKIALDITDAGEMPKFKVTR